MAPIKWGRSQPIGGTMIPGISFIKFGSGGRNAVQEAWQLSLWLFPDMHWA